MQSKAQTVAEYLEQLPEDRRNTVTRLHQIIKDNLPNGFQETMSYGMLGYVVPHTIYPSGYHCDPKLPLPFMALASQKNSINIYNMAVYADNSLYNWFVAEYPKYSNAKLDMGKSCIRFKKPEDIPYELIAQLCQKVSVKDWINLYEANYKPSKK